MNLVELMIALILILIAVVMIIYSTMAYVNQLRNFKNREDRVLQDFDFVNYAYDYMNSLVRGESTPVVDFATVEDEGTVVEIKDKNGSMSIRIIKW